MSTESLPPRYLKRFYDLLDELQTKYRESQSPYVGPYDEPILIAEIEESKSNIVSLLDPILPKDHAHREWMKELLKPEDFSQGLDYYQNRFMWLFGRLNGLRKDFEGGMLGDLSLHMEQQVASEYLDQASLLLREVEANNRSHIPAAAIAGAVLERFLHNVCSVHSIDTSRRDGISSLTDKLTEYLSEEEKQSLEGWRSIRNHVSHGRFDEVSKEDVENMLTRMWSFIDQHSDFEVLNTGSSD